MSLRRRQTTSRPPRHRQSHARKEKKRKGSLITISFPVFSQEETSTIYMALSGFWSHPPMCDLVEETNICVFSWLNRMLMTNFLL
jgi:hypothetical protein